MNIKPLEKEDLPIINSLKPDDWNDLTYIHEFYLNNNFCYPRKVVIDNKIAGIGTAIHHNRTGWLAHIIVLPEFRNKGIGSLIVLSLINILKNDLLCESISLIVTDLGAPVYLKNGFTIQSEYCVYNNDNSVRENNSFENIMPANADHFNKIFQLDRVVAGEDRIKILSQYIDGAFVSISAKTVNGFYMPRLGEGLIISNSKENGINLLRMSIQSKNRIVVPFENEIARDDLLKSGFKETQKIKRMIFGKEFRWIPENVYSRISGYLG